MDQQQCLLSLIEDLYSAPGTESGWSLFLDRLCGVVNGSGASFISIASPDRRANVMATVRTDPEALKAYQTHWGALDPWGHSPVLDRVHAGTVVRGDDLISHLAVKETAFYRDFGRQYGIVRCLVGTIETRRHGVSVISINGTERRGAFSSRDSALLTALMPHLQRSLQLHRRLLTQEAMTKDLSEVLDVAANPVILVDAAGRVSFMNRAAECLVGNRDGLAVHAGELRAARVADTDRLRTLIFNAAAPSSASAGRSGGTLALGRPSGRMPLIVNVFPVSRNRLTPGETERAVAMVVVTEPDRTDVADEGTLRALYGLTVAEAKLVRLLAQGVTLMEAGTRLGLRRETVRSRVKTIFAKTNTHGQTELVRRVLLSVPRV